MDRKFGRSYSLSIETQTGTKITVEPPFTVTFDITRNVLPSANSINLHVYNLSQNTRSQIAKNAYDIGDLRAIEFKAGYGINLPIAAQGMATQIQSGRQGTDFITEIEAFDGGFGYVNGFFNETFPEGTEFKTLIKTMVDALPGIKAGVIGNYDGKLGRGNSYSGNSSDLLRELTGGGFFVDNGKAHVLKTNECLQGEIQVINSQSGLLGTPIQQQNMLYFDILFEPRLLIGQLIELKSITNKNFNHFYKVVSLSHKGTISDAVCGEAITSIGVYSGAGSLITVGAA